MTFCLLGANCSVFDAALKVPGLSFGNPICEGCKRRTESELEMLRLDYVDLTQLLPDVGSDNQVHIRRPKPESTPPLNMQAFTLRHRIAHVALLADSAVRERMQLAPLPRPMREGVALEQALGTLRAHLKALAALEVVSGCWDPDTELYEDLDGPQILTLMSGLHRRARVMLGLTSPILSMPGQCPNCQVAALRRQADTPQRIWCAACKVVMDRQAYMDMLSLKIRA